MRESMKIGIIGGSGLDDPSLFQKEKEAVVETPYGKPSSALNIGKIDGVDVVHLARHGKNHQLSPRFSNHHHSSDSPGT